MSARVYGWNDRAELVEVYEQGRKQFFDDGGWQDPEVRRHECGLLAVANYVAHEPSEPDAKRVGTSPEPANETPES